MRSFWELIAKFVTLRYVLYSFIRSFFCFKSNHLSLLVLKFRFPDPWVKNTGKNSGALILLSSTSVTFCISLLSLNFLCIANFYIYIFSVLSSLLGNIITFFENLSTLKVYHASDIALMPFSFLKLTFAVSYSNFYLQSEAGKKLPFILVINLQVWSYLLVSCHIFEMSNIFSDLYFIFHYVVICYQNMLNLCNWSGARTKVHKMDLPDVYLSWTSCLTYKIWSFYLNVEQERHYLLRSLYWLTF